MILRRAEHSQMCVLKGSHCLSGKARSGRIVSGLKRAQAKGMGGNGCLCEGL